MVRILVDYGTNVDTVNGEGQTALHIAAEIGDEALVKYFYGVRASASIADNQGERKLICRCWPSTHVSHPARRSHANALGSRERPCEHHRAAG
jgi:Ankyrin repeats (many copies)